MKWCIALLFLLFVGSVRCCSIQPNVPFYSIIQRTILSPIVVHGRVINTTATPSNWQQFDACIQVLQVIKGDKNLPRQMCFGDFGTESLCLTYVNVGVEYVFFMTADRKANYRDGEPKYSAAVANSQAITQAKQGVCDSIKSSNCRSPVISRENFQPIVRAQEGQTVELSCYATGTQPMVLQWSKKGTVSRFDFPSNYNKLRIPSVTMDDMGVYQCTFENAGGRTSALIRLFINPIPCGGFLTLRPGETQVIMSPNYPRPYGHDKMCSWRICPSRGYRVKLDFKHFDLGRHTGDNLQIIHECEPVRSIVKYCTDTSPGQFVSKCTSRCMQVWFHSSRSKNNMNLSNGPYGVLANASATTDATSLFDYKKLYCENEILVKFIPTDTSYFSSTKGQVIEGYKGFTASGRDITIRSFDVEVVNTEIISTSKIDNSIHTLSNRMQTSRSILSEIPVLTDSLLLWTNRLLLAVVHAITSLSPSYIDNDIFGCRAATVKSNQEYYVGMRSRGANNYDLNFIHPVNEANKPAKLDENLIKFKTNPPSC